MHLLLHHALNIHWVPCQRVLYHDLKPFHYILQPLYCIMTRHLALRQLYHIVKPHLVSKQLYRISARRQLYRFTMHWSPLPHPEAPL